MKHFFKSLILILALIFASGNSLFGQDIQFSNIHQSLVFSNPALSGNQHEFEALSVFRSQWKNQAYGFQDVGFGIHARIPSKNKKGGKLAIGLNGLQNENKAKTLRSTFIQGNVAYHFNLSPRNQLSTAIYVGYFSMNYNTASGTWGSQHDGTRYDGGIQSGEAFQTNQIQRIDAGSGLVFSHFSKTKSRSRQHPVFQSGLAFYHVSRPNLGTNTNYLPMKLNAFVALNGMTSNSMLRFSPIVLYSRQQEFQKLQGGFRLSYLFKEKSRYTSSYLLPKHNSFSISTYLSSVGNLTTGFSLSYQRCELNLSYDYFLGKVNTSFSRAALEIGLSFKLRSYQKEMVF